EQRPALEDVEGRVAPERREVVEVPEVVEAGLVGDAPDGAELVGSRALLGELEPDPEHSAGGYPQTSRVSSGYCQKPLESRLEAVPVRLPYAAAREMDRGPIEPFEHVEHRPVLVFQEAPGHVNLVLRRYAYQVLVECPMMDRAEAQAVRYVSS